MKSYGNEFRPEWWRDLFNIVFRIFDHAKMDQNRGDKKEWMMTTCNHAMYAIVDVFTQYYPQLSELVLPSIYDQFAVCIQQSIVLFGNCLLLTWEPDIRSSPEKTQGNFTVDYDGLANVEGRRNGLCEALGESQRLAKQFNDNNCQRTLLWKAGLRGSSKPNLIKQETHALRAMLAILLRLLNDPRSDSVRDQVTKNVLSFKACCFLAKYAIVFIHHIFNLVEKEVLILGISSHPAILGFHVVVSLVMLTIISKLSSRMFIIQMYITKGEEDIPDGFKVPKSLPLRLKMKRVEEVDLHNLPLYSSFYWLSLFVPHCLVVLVRLTSWLVVNQEERNVLLIFAAIFFLFAFIFTTQADHFFDIQLLAGMLLFKCFSFHTKSCLHRVGFHCVSGYDQFCANIEALVAEAGITDQKNAKSRDPIILLVLHATFILPFVTLLLYTLSLKEQLVYGPRKIFNEEQFNILRIYLTITVLVFRLLFRTAHFQILQYYSYICVAVLQYFSPVLLSSFLALLLKTAGRMSWLGRESVLPSTSVGGMISILDPVVCRALLSFSLLFTTLTNVVLSSIGVMYNSNLLP
ncbi:hypothetical protein DICVIV_12440 [Dictyocaulus viviparus]|uniref:Sec7/BIG1-like C-terminal domain-containing protein n=1 Tax=Dictyocaulus viviparus TaxID=29172 RepID=A0A0D8XGT8_DICVI|nr:hypothetical protein DICVIV_12440 [Dictyocaulus viviparus]